jgi:hypothetical protein
MKVNIHNVVQAVAWEKLCSQRKQKEGLVVFLRIVRATSANSGVM